MNFNSTYDDNRTIDLSAVFFLPHSCTFNWRAVAILLDDWKMAAGRSHYAFMFVPDEPPPGCVNPQLQSIHYRQAGLSLSQGYPDQVTWFTGNPDKGAPGGSPTPGCPAIRLH